LVSRIEHSALAPLPNKKRPLAEFCSNFASGRFLLGSGARALYSMRETNRLLGQD